MPVEVREWIAPAPSSPDFVLEAQPPAQPHRRVSIERSIRLADGSYREVVRPSAQRAVHFAHQRRGLFLPRRYPASSVLRASPPPHERPASPSRTSGWSSLTALRGFPCCGRFPCVRAAASTPVQRLSVVFAHLTQPCQPSPKLQSGRPAHRPFRGLRGVHSRCGPHTRAVTYM